MIGRLLLILALLLPAPGIAWAQAVTFTILTQNVLRFGHGRRLAAQCAAITAAAPQFDIIVMQEVMAPGYPCLAANNNKGVNGVYPMGFAYRTSGPMGQSSYIEYYGILYRTGLGGNNIAPIGNGQTLGGYAQFARPPFGQLFRITGANGQFCDVWIVDFHAVFGDSIVLRRDEAEAMENIYQNLRALNNGRVLMVGDWNLDADDDGFDWVRDNANNAEINPNVQTSLTRAGALSSPYDHAVSQRGPALQVQPLNPPNGWTYDGGNQGTWRTNVSDHLGVQLRVTVTC